MSDNDDEWLEDNEDDEEEESLSVVSLFDDQVFPDAASMLSYCKEKHNFDFLAVRDRLRLDFHGTVKLINFIRQRVRQGEPLPKEISASDLEDDLYLKPVLEDDALIMCLDDLPEVPVGQEEGPAGDQAGTGADGSNSGAPVSAEELMRRNVELQTELENLSKQFNSYRLAVQQTLDKRWGADDDEGTKAEASAGPSGTPATGQSDSGKDDSAYYWESYAHNDIHEIMLKDRVRTDAYRDFIYANKNLFVGKVVLDVGCGTGILSMFCAKAGAKQVIAVDNSDIINRARVNIFNNGLSDQITCLKGRMEDVVLPVKEVDIIVSEWMGYCLLYEAMLPSVIWARDRYLRSGGLMVPSHASIWVAPVSDPDFIADNVAFWRDVYGFDMKAMQEGMYRDVRIQTLPARSLGGSAYPFRFLDLHKVKVEDLVFNAEWQSKMLAEAEELDGFLLWFDMFFATEPEDRSIIPEVTAKDWAVGGRERVAFTTGPYGEETHWKQGLFILEDQFRDVPCKGGQDVRGRISFAIPSDHARGLEISISWEIEGQEEHSQKWLVH
ncbi:hypothetical protein VTK73DRAFT_3298 [Phialemonium thermophilum]|uniref:type I protein arginine methyltransferase n=1 Tax=Phialemonium thermophilum TaxID=223376 RepID=A0ABR3Y1U6_9PEZI